MRHVVEQVMLWAPDSRWVLTGWTKLNAATPDVMQSNPQAWPRRRAPNRERTEDPLKPTQAENTATHSSTIATAC